MGSSRFPRYSATGPAVATTAGAAAAVPIGASVASVREVIRA